MEKRIIKIISEILNIDSELIKIEDTPDTIEEWDSLKQMNIIISLEEEFDIIFNDEQIEQLRSIKSICSIVVDLINENEK